MTDMTIAGLVNAVASMPVAMRLGLLVALRERGICTRCGANISRRSPHKCDIPDTEGQ